MFQRNRRLLFVL